MFASETTPLIQEREEHLSVAQPCDSKGAPSNQNNHSHSVRPSLTRPMSVYVVYTVTTSFNLVWILICNYLSFALLVDTSDVVFYLNICYGT